MKIKYKVLIIISITIIVFLFWCWNRKSVDGYLIDNLLEQKSYELPPKNKLFYNLSINTIPKSLKIDNEVYKIEPIQKKVYRTWCKEKSIGICGGRRADINVLTVTQKNLPNWEQIIYTDKDIDQFLEKEFGKDHRITKAYYLINPKYSASRADLFRYLVIYKYGGLYLDMKSCVKGPLPEIPPNMDMWVSSWNHYKKVGNLVHMDLFTQTGEYQNWYIYARKNAPILKDIIEKVVNNIYEFHENPNTNYNLVLNSNLEITISKGIVLSITGPIAMTIAIIGSENNKSVYYNNSINNFLYYNCKTNNENMIDGHYSIQTEPLIKPKNDINYIPKIVYMTYDDLEKIPQYVKDNIKKYCKGYDIQIYDDDMCIEFLSKYYGKDAVSIFNNMKINAHKADFWRYCILYLFGGFYFDIKTDFRIPINQVFNSKLPNTWYTVIADQKKNSIYNDIIVTPSQNPILLKAIEYFYKNPNPPHYTYYIEHLYKILSEQCKNKLNIGNNIQKNNWNCILFLEECYSNCRNDCDQYNLNCIINNEKGEKVFNTRYKDFPWKNTFKYKIGSNIKPTKTYVSMTTIPERLKNEWFFQ